MSNTVITNYTDLNGPSSKADSSVVVIVNKDGSLSVDQKLLGTLIGSHGSQAAGISVVRVGHEGKPDDATDSENEDENVPHLTLSVDSYYDEPNSIIKYDSGAEILQSLRLETRENSLLGFQNDHCYTPFLSPGQDSTPKNENYASFDEPVIEIVHTAPPKPVSNPKKITILDQKVIPKGKKIVINSNEPSILLKGKDVLNKSLPVIAKSKQPNVDKKTEDNSDTTTSSSDESIPDRDSDSDYKDTTTDSVKQRKRLKPAILKQQTFKPSKLETKVSSRVKPSKNVLKREIKEKNQRKSIDVEKKLSEQPSTPKENNLEGTIVGAANIDPSKNVGKPISKQVRKEKKTPAHMTALLSDMTSLFSTPDVIRRVSTDNKIPSKTEKESPPGKKLVDTSSISESGHEKTLDNSKVLDNKEKTKSQTPLRSYTKQKDKNVNPTDKATKSYDPIPQLDDASLAQILQDTTGIASISAKGNPNISTTNTMNSPGLAGPLSPTLDLLGGLQPEEEGWTEDLLMHVAQLVENSPNLQEVIDKQVLNKADTAPKPHIQPPFQQPQGNIYGVTSPKSGKTLAPRKDPIEIVRRDGRVITLPPIEAPATRASKRKNQLDTSSNEALSPTAYSLATPEPVVQQISTKQYVNKKLTSKKQEQAIPTPTVDKIVAESQESWNSEDDPNRLWCICKQPHNNRFMICCDGCEDWFHGKCVNITKAMGQQMEEQGVEWRCPNCVKKKSTPKSTPKVATIPVQRKQEIEGKLHPVQQQPTPAKVSSFKTCCIVCKKAARASSIYCSDMCILKHAQDSLSTGNKEGSDTGKPSDRNKAESRVIVYERKSGRVLAGPNAPTPENLKFWLQKNPTFEVVRPGALSAIKPNVTSKKTSNEPNKIQTMLNFERIPKKITTTQAQTTPLRPQQAQTTPSRPQQAQTTPSRPQQAEVKENTMKTVTPKEVKTVPTPKTPVTPKSQAPQYADTPKAGTSAAKSVNEPRKIMRTLSRSQPTYEKTPSVPSVASRRKDTAISENKNKMNSPEPIRDNVRKALLEQLTIRMAENKGAKFTEHEIQEFANDTESELHELFKDVGMKYKAKYRSLMFNIKDRKNQSLWQKICDRSLAPKQLVRLSPEELASQELAEWRDQETKHQLELIKKSEIDLLAASKTYVLKTHKGEEVMETKESVSTELDPNLPVEDLVTALNDSTVGDMSLNTSSEEKPSNIDGAQKERGSDRKRKKEDSSGHAKKKRRESRRESTKKKSRSSRRDSDGKDKDRSTRRADKKSKDRDKPEATDRPRSRSRSRARPERRPRERSRTASRGRARRSRSRDSARGGHRSRSRDSARGARRSRSRDSARGTHRSRSRDSARGAHRSRSKHRASTDDKGKLRSKSQDAAYSTGKNDSTDSESLERPKSAMLKEVHPEYDPHEPMITSAFSEEDLRKSREDVFEDTYKTDLEQYDVEFGSSKDLSIDTNAAMSSANVEQVEKDSAVTEAESDQEPSSTVENASATVWNGCINMVDVARFYVSAHEVSGSSSDLEEDLSTELDIVGRINPDTVWDYIGKMKKTSNKDIIILKLQAANDEEKMQYIALYSYLSSRNRLGVVKVSNTTLVKDFYVVPLPAQSGLPRVLLPLDGPGLGDARTHLLLAIVIRQRKKRPAPLLPKDIIPTKAMRAARKRSCSPPAPGAPAPPAPAPPAPASYTPPASPRRRAALPLPAYTSPALSTSVKDKIAASLAAADEDEAYSPGSSSSGGSAGAAAGAAAGAGAGGEDSLRCKMEELNRQIEEQKQQIRKMAQVDSSVTEEEEAYSPSRPMTPPGAVPLADIALPSNLQEILATIKQRSETATAEGAAHSLPLP